jgi:hypothetical protein
MYHTVIAVTPAENARKTESDYSPLLLLPFVAMAAHHFTKKQMHRANNKMLWQLMKLKAKSMFSPKAKKRMSPGLKLILLATLIGLAFGVIVSIAAGVIAFVASLVLFPFVVAKKE